MVVLLKQDQGDVDSKKEMCEKLEDGLKMETTVSDLEKEIEAFKRDKIEARRRKDSVEGHLRDGEEKIGME